MKTKTFLNLTLIFILPLFCSTLMICCISAEWMITTNHTSQLATMFLTGKYNFGITLILFGMGFLSCGVSVYFAFWVKAHAAAIDKLEKIDLIDKREDLLYLNQIKNYINKR